MLSPGPKGIWVVGRCFGFCPPPFFSNSSSKCICSGLHFQWTQFSWENLINLCYYENDYWRLSVSFSFGNIFEFQKGIYGHHATTPPPNFKWCDFFLLLYKTHGVLHEKLALIISILLLLWVSPTSTLLNKENMCLFLQNNTFWILLKCRFPWITSWRRREMAVWAHRWNPITGASMRRYIVL